MFDISELKEMKLPELQEIAKKAKINKYRGLKKDELVYQILDHQAANPSTIKPLFEEAAPAANTIEQPTEKAKRARIAPDNAKKESVIKKTEQSKPSPIVPTPIADTEVEKKDTPFAKAKPELKKPLEAKTETTSTETPAVIAEDALKVVPQDKEVPVKEDGRKRTAPAKDNAQARQAAAGADAKPGNRPQKPQLSEEERLAQIERANANNPNHPSYKGNLNKDEGAATQPAAVIAPPVTPPKNTSQNKKQNYREPDYEFDGIIESEGVLEMMPDGYGFLTIIRLQLPCIS